MAVGLTVTLDCQELLNGCFGAAPCYPAIAAQLAQLAMAESEGDATAAAAAASASAADAEPEAEAVAPAQPAESEPEAEASTEPGGDVPAADDGGDQGGAVDAEGGGADAEDLDLSSWKTEMADDLTADRPRRQMVQLAHTNAQLKKIVEYNHGLVGEVVSKLRDDLIRPFFAGWKKALAEELERGRRERKGIKLVGGIEMQQRGKDGNEEMQPVVVGRARLRDLLWHWFNFSRVERNDKQLIQRNLQRQARKNVALGFYTMLGRVELKKRRANVVKKVYKRLVGVRVNCAWKGWHAHYLHEKHNRVKVRSLHSAASLHLFVQLTQSRLPTEKPDVKEACVQHQHAKPQRLEALPARVEAPQTSCQAIAEPAEGEQAARRVQWVVPGVDAEETQPRTVGPSFREACQSRSVGCIQRVGSTTCRHKT